LARNRKYPTAAGESLKRVLTKSVPSGSGYGIR